MNLHAHSFTEEPLDPDAIEALHIVGDELLKPRDAAVDAVRAAGRELVEFGLAPAKDILAIKISEDRRAQRIHRVLLAWLLHHANSKTGIAFPGFKLLAALLDYNESDLRSACSELAAMGYLVRTAGNRTGAHGRKGPSFGFTPAKSISWAEAKVELQERKERAKSAVASSRGDKNVPAEGNDIEENVPAEGNVAEWNVPAEVDDLADNVPLYGNDCSQKRSRRARGSTNLRGVEPPKEIELPRSEGEQGEATSSLTTLGHSVVEVVATELLPMSFGAPARAGQLPLGDDADASGLVMRVLRELGIAETDRSSARKVATTVRKALDRWLDTQPDSRGYRRGYKRFDVYFLDQWLDRLSNDIRKLDARREITDRQIASERSLPSPDDGQGPWRYPRGTKAKWVNGLNQSIEVDTLNGWLTEADKRYGTQIARQRDLDELLGQIEPHNDVVDLILQAAILRVHGYNGGAVPVDHSLIEDVLLKHPNVPRDFAKAHVENCYADPAAVGLRPRKYDGADWLANLRNATVNVFDRVLSDAQRQWTKLFWQDCQAMEQAFSCPEIAQLNIAVYPVCKANWTNAFEKDADQQNPFADHSGWSATAVAGVKARLLEMLEELLSRGPVNPTRSWSVSSHRNNCEKAIAHVRSVNWMPIPRRLNAVPPKLLSA